jgi:transcriptional regulator with XRE-family HTH domain
MGNTFQDCVGSRLRAVRQDREHTLVELGDLAGMSHRAVGGYESQRWKQVPVRTLWALCRALDVDLVALVDMSSTTWRRSSWSPETLAADELVDLVRDRLRQVRHDLGRGSKALAAEAEVHQTWIVRIESGEVDTVDLVRLDRCARAMGVPLTTLLTSEKRDEARADRRTADGPGARDESTSNAA